MRRFGEDVSKVNDDTGTRSTQSGAIASSSDGGRHVTLNNMFSSQVRNMMSIMPYGFASNPIPGLVAFSVSADSGGRDGIIGVFDPNKPMCGAGEAMVYGSGGAKVKCSSYTSVDGMAVVSEINELKRRMKEAEDTLEDHEDRITALGG